MMAAERRKIRKRKSFLESVGHWIFLIGTILAIVLGVLLPARLWIAGILAALGLMVGIINITKKEYNQFLLAAVALIISSQAMKYIPVFGNILGNIAAYLSIFVAIAAVVISLIVIWKLAKER